MKFYFFLRFSILLFSNSVLSLCFLRFFLTLSNLADEIRFSLASFTSGANFFNTKDFFCPIISIKTRPFASYVLRGYLLWVSISATYFSFFAAVRTSSTNGLSVQISLCNLRPNLIGRFLSKYCGQKIDNPFLRILIPY